MSVPSSSHKPVPPTPCTSNHAHFVRIRIHSIEKANNDLVVRFDVHTNLAHFRHSTYARVSRTYRELCLYSLALSLSSPALIVPALPLPSTTAGGVDDTRILRLMLARWFSRVLDHPVLRDHVETRWFVEADFVYSPTPPAEGSSAAARKRFANAIASVANVAYGGVDSTGALPNGVLATSASARSSTATSPFGFLGIASASKRLATSSCVYDDDHQLVAARAEVTRLEMQFADAAQAAEKLAHSRRSLTIPLTHLSIKLTNLAAVEQTTPQSTRLALPYLLKRTAHTLRILGDLGDALSNTQLLTLGDAVAYQSINARAAKEAMLSRNALVEEHHLAQKATLNKKRQAEHLKLQPNLRAHKLDHALHELEIAKRHQHALAIHLGHISRELTHSLHTHSRFAHHDLQLALVEHARGSVMFSRQLLSEMVALRCELELTSVRLAQAQPCTSLEPRSSESIPTTTTTTTTTMGTMRRMSQSLQVASPQPMYSTLNSGNSGTPSGRSRLSAAEAAKSLAGKF